MTEFNKKIIQGLQEMLQAFTFSEKTKFIIGLSGGLDSIVLLHAMSQCVEWETITAVHVDHQLQSESAIWSKFCQAYCDSLNIAFISASVDVAKLKENQPKSSPEALARDARYAIFKNYIEEDAILLTAHHADDQVETFLLQLMRGAGSKGLQSMPLNKAFNLGQHLRPLLGFTRNELEEYARFHQLESIDDTSNADISFDRNYLRHQVLPALGKRWPKYQNSVLSSIQNLSSERRVLLNVLRQQYPDFFEREPLLLANFLDKDDDSKNILFRLWLELHCTQLPPQVRVQEFLRQLNSIDSLKQIELTWLEYAVRVYKDKIYFLNKWTKKENACWQKLVNMELNMEVNTVLELPNAAGKIEVVSRSVNHNFCIQFRQGGESLRLPENNFHSKLKSLFNEKSVFPWWRSRIPLIYADNQLVAVADLWLNADWLEQHEIHDFEVIWHNRPQIMPEKIQL